MKKLILILAALLSVATLSAQNAITLQPRHSVEISGYPFSPTAAEISVSSGLQIGHSLYLGIGTGFGMLGTCKVYTPEIATKQTNINGGDYIPVFLDIKWNVIDGDYAPFLQTRVGYECSLTYKEVGKYLNAAIGMNIRGLSVSICYTLHQIMPTLDSLSDNADLANINETFLLKFDYPSLRIGWTF